MSVCVCVMLCVAVRCCVMLCVVVVCVCGHSRIRHFLHGHRDSDNLIREASGASCASRPLQHTLVRACTSSYKQKPKP